jgi:hypothetical protein
MFQEFGVFFLFFPFFSEFAMKNGILVLYPSLAFEDVG